MPTIICSYCQYVGSGSTHIAILADVEEHEATCKENPDTEPVEDEYELCEITMCEENGLLYDPHGKGMFSISKAVNSPAFVGYEVDGQLFGRLYKHKYSDSYYLSIPAEKLDNYTVCDMTGAKVIFYK